MASWLRDQENGYLPSVRLVRCVRWDTLHEVPPVDAQSRTRLLAPRIEIRRQIKTAGAHGALARTAGTRRRGVHRRAGSDLWLDLQYFQHVALDHLGAPDHGGGRELLRADFALFLARVPGIERVAFDDGTAFADDATLSWIAAARGRARSRRGRDGDTAAGFGR